MGGCSSQPNQQSCGNCERNKYFNALLRNQITQQAYDNRQKSTSESEQLRLALQQNIALRTEIAAVKLKTGKTEQSEGDLSGIVSAINRDVMFGHGLRRDCPGTEEFHMRRQQLCNRTGFDYHRCFDRNASAIQHVVFWFVPLLNGRRSSEHMKPLNETEVIFKSKIDLQKGVRCSFGLDWNESTGRKELPTYVLSENENCDVSQ